MFQWYRDLPTWVKWTIPIGVVGTGYLMFRNGTEEGTDENGAVLPLITPSTGPSFPAGVFGGGGGDYAPMSGGGGPSGSSSLIEPALPPSPPPSEGGSIGGGGPGGTDMQPAPPSIDAYNPPEEPRGPGPLSPKQQKKIQERLQGINQRFRDRIEEIETRRANQIQQNEARREKKIQAINASNAGEGVKRARRQAINATHAAEKVAINSWFAGRKALAATTAETARVAARAMFGEGRV